MNLHITTELLELTRSFNSAIPDTQSRPDFTRAYNDMAHEIARKVAGLVHAADYAEKLQQTYYNHNQIATILDNAEERIHPELEDCELPSGDYAYPCADCEMNTLVEDPYNFDPTDHVCGMNRCEADIITKRVA